MNRMNRRRTIVRVAAGAATIAAGVMWLAAGATDATAGEASPPLSARAGEDLARAAARAWSADARLVYVENDEPIGPDGRSARWGYLFRSEARAASRVYSVQGGGIRVAADPPYDFDAPPLPAAWIDSDAARRIADEAEGTRWLAEHGGRVRAMFLLRGVMDPERPDAPTWAVVYEADGAPGLWVVVDAARGKVVKRWRG